MHIKLVSGKVREESRIDLLLMSHSVPTQPLDFRLEDVLNAPTQLIARWLVPESPNGMILAYSVYCDTSLLPTVVSGDATMVTLTGLSPFTDYECYVTASTGAGEGYPSNIDTEITVEDGGWNTIIIIPLF